MHASQVLNAFETSTAASGIVAALGDDQLRWVQAQLSVAESANERVIVLSHTPLSTLADGDLAVAALAARTGVVASSISLAAAGAVPSHSTDQNGVHHIALCAASGTGWLAPPYIYMDMDMDMCAASGTGWLASSDTYWPLHTYTCTWAYTCTCTYWHHRTPTGPSVLTSPGPCVCPSMLTSPGPCVWASMLTSPGPCAILAWQASRAPDCPITQLPNCPIAQLPNCLIGPIAQLAQLQIA